MTKTTEIARIEWPTFCECFTRQHRGWLASVEVSEASTINLQPGDTGSRMNSVARNLSLQGVTLEQRGAETELLVTVGRGSRLLTHRVMRPIRISAVVTDSGAHEGLHVREAGGAEMQIHFRVPVKPETLNAWVEP